MNWIMKTFRPRAWNEAQRVKRNRESRLQQARDSTQSIQIIAQTYCDTVPPGCVSGARKVLVRFDDLSRIASMAGFIDSVV